MRSGLSLLRCGSQFIACGDVGALAVPRAHPQAFEGDGPVSLRIERVKQAHPKARPLEGALTPWGDFALEGSTLYAHIPDDVWAAEAVLRIAWQVSTLRQGGLLMHGCAFAWGTRGLAAIGESTAGKSTLAALSCGPPGNATLLTDEIVQLFPDGTCYGTPFRSDEQNVGAPGPARLRSLLLLTKGASESVVPEPAADALKTLLGQIFGAVVDVVPRGEIIRRVMSLVDTVGVHRLTFRKDPAVGPFLRDWVAS